MAYFGSVGEKSVKILRLLLILTHKRKTIHNAEPHSTTCNVLFAQQSVPIIVHLSFDIEQLILTHIQQ